MIDLINSSYINALFFIFEIDATSEKSQHILMVTGHTLSHVYEFDTENKSLATGSFSPRKLLCE